MIGIGIYVQNSPKAIEMYKSAFGLELGYHVLNNDGTYYHSELIKNGEEFCCVVEAKQDTYTDRNPIELVCLSILVMNLNRHLQFYQTAVKLN